MGMVATLCAGQSCNYAALPQPQSFRASLGLKENWRQFALLVRINAFVGGMVGIERTEGRTERR